jgi:hypothetical protein
MLPIERINRAILFVRGQKVMLGSDRAGLYGVEPPALIQAVRRNRERFPHDFMCPLTKREWSDLESQIAISSWGGAQP